MPIEKYLKIWQFSLSEKEVFCREADHSGLYLGLVHYDSWDIGFVPGKWEATI